MKEKQCRYRCSTSGTERERLAWSLMRLREKKKEKSFTKLELLRINTVCAVFHLTSACKLNLKCQDRYRMEIAAEIMVNTLLLLRGGQEVVEYLSM